MPSGSLTACDFRVEEMRLDKPTAEQTQAGLIRCQGAQLDPQLRFPHALFSATEDVARATVQVLLDRCPKPFCPIGQHTWLLRYSNNDVSRG